MTDYSAIKRARSVAGLKALTADAKNPKHRFRIFGNVLRAKDTPKEVKDLIFEYQKQIPSDFPTYKQQVFLKYDKKRSLAEKDNLIAAGHDVTLTLKDGRILSGVISYQGRREKYGNRIAKYTPEQMMAADAAMSRWTAAQWKEKGRGKY